MKRIIFSILLTLLVATSCQSFFKKNQILARIGTMMLYAGDVIPLLPEGISPEDSVAMIQNYIDKWALGHLMEMKAEEQLSKKEKDISAEVEAYSRSLLNFRFEKSYVESRIDTTITQAEKQEYYDTHIQSFTYPYSLYKVRAITISTHSPYFEMVKKNFKTTNPELLAELEETCRSYAEKYDTYSGEWVSASTIAKDFAFEANLCEQSLSQTNSYVYEDEVKEKCYFVFVEEKIEPNNLSPIEYNYKKIQDAILSKRKQDLLKSLEESLLNDAYQNNKLKIYTNE